MFAQLAVDHGLGRKREIVADSDFVMYEKVQVKHLYEAVKSRI